MKEELLKIGFKHIGSTLDYCSEVYRYPEKDILIYEHKGVFEFADTGIEIENIEEVVNAL